MNTFLTEVLRFQLQVVGRYLSNLNYTVWCFSTLKISFLLFHSFFKRKRRITNHHKTICIED